MTIVNLPDVAGANSATRLVSTAGPKARWIMITPSGANGTRIGGSTVAAASGLSLLQNGTYTFNTNSADPLDAIDLYNTWIYAPSGATITISYGQA
jgi:hypothetical protein